MTPQAMHVDYPRMNIDPQSCRLFTAVETITSAMQVYYVIETKPLFM
jgi:hypothetical protein